MMWKDEDINYYAFLGWLNLLSFSLCYAVRCCTCGIMVLRCTMCNRHYVRTHITCLHDCVRACVCVCVCVCLAVFFFCLRFCEYVVDLNVLSSIVSLCGCAELARFGLT